MKKITVTVSAAALGWVITMAPVLAEEKTLADIKAQNIPRVSKEELAALLPGSTFQQISGVRSNVRTYWKHEPDGTLNGMRSASIRNASRTGKWSVNDNGAYCVDIHGQTEDDAVKWCRIIYKAGDDYFGYAATANDSTRAISFTLSK